MVGLVVDLGGVTQQQLIDGIVIPPVMWFIFFLYFFIWLRKGIHYFALIMSF